MYHTVQSQIGKKKNRNESYDEYVKVYNVSHTRFTSIFWKLSYLKFQDTKEGSSRENMNDSFDTVSFQQNLLWVNWVTHAYQCREGWRRRKKTGKSQIFTSSWSQCYSRLTSKQSIQFRHCSWQSVLVNFKLVQISSLS